MKTYTNRVELYIVLRIHAKGFVEFHQIENHRTNCSIYDFFVQKSILYQIQQGGICTLSNLDEWRREKKSLKMSS